MRICLAQINSHVGDIIGNQKRIISAIKQAQNEQAEIIVFPELTLSGYGCGDWLLHDYFISACEQALEAIIKAASHLIVVVGLPRSAPPSTDGQPRCYNSAAIIENAKLLGFYDKQKRPNYLLFNEPRHFIAGQQLGNFKVNLKHREINLGISICEDIWHQAEPVAAQVAAGAELLINLGASPYAIGKPNTRQQSFTATAKRFNRPLVYLNAVGGQDDLLFDGHSGVITAQASQSLAGFREEIKTIDIKQIKTADRLNQDDDNKQLYQALTLAVRDYVYKNGFKHVALGLSGGIDSALVATLAADALGANNVTAIMMPSQYSSQHSISDSEQLARNLGIKTHTLSIEKTHQLFAQQLTPLFADYHQGLTDENIQARIRGLMLMAYANNQNCLVLATSNKSESMVGYSTLYGDMVGGFAPIIDVYKAQVYALCNQRNQLNPVIPQNIIDKPPSAELKPDQKDSDSLPDYDVLDAILTAFIEQRKDPLVIAKQLNTPISEIKAIIQKVNRSEYKRRQGAIGPSVSAMKSGTDRRLPITFRPNF